MEKRIDRDRLLGVSLSDIYRDERGDRRLARSLGRSRRGARLRGLGRSGGRDLDLGDGKRASQDRESENCQRFPELPTLRDHSSSLEIANASGFSSELPTVGEELSSPIANDS